MSPALLSRRSKRIRALVLAAVASTLCLAGPALADSDLDAKKAKWVQQYQELTARHAQLKANLDQARMDYSRGRSTRDLVGEGKAGLIADIDKMEKEFAEVDRELQEFPEKARRGGAFPGWFRDVGPAASAGAAATAAPDPRASGALGGGRTESLSERNARLRSERRERQRNALDSRDDDEDVRAPSASDRRAKSRDRRRLR